MKKWLILFALLLCWIITAFVIYNNRQKNITQTQTKQFSPQRIIPLAPNLTDILFELGIGEKIVAIPTSAKDPNKYSDKNQIGNFWQPDIEAIIANKPDLVITLSFSQQQLVADRLKRIGCNCLTVKIESIDQLFEAINLIGKTINKQKESTELIDKIKLSLSQISDKVKNKTKPKTIYVVQQQPLRVAGTDTFINDMIEKAGGTNAIGTTIYKYPPIATEQLIASQPEVIIIPAMGNENLAAVKKQALQFWSRYETLPAVKNRRIYVINDDTVSQLGPSIHKGVELIYQYLWEESCQ